jgi:hypothetical protein
MFIGWSSTNFDRHKNNINFVEDLPMTIPGKFGFYCPSGFREEAFSNIFTLWENVQMPQKLQILLKPNCT